MLFQHKPPRLLCLPLLSRDHLILRLDVCIHTVTLAPFCQVCLHYRDLREGLKAASKAAAAQQHIVEESPSQKADPCCTQQGQPQLPAITLSASPRQSVPSCSTSATGDRSLPLLRATLPARVLSLSAASDCARPEHAQPASCRGSTSTQRAQGGLGSSSPGGGPSQVQALIQAFDHRQPWSRPRPYTGPYRLLLNVMWPHCVASLCCLLIARRAPQALLASALLG